MARTKPQPQQVEKPVGGVKFINDVFPDLPNLVCNQIGCNEPIEGQIQVAVASNGVVTFSGRCVNSHRNGRALSHIEIGQLANIGYEKGSPGAINYVYLPKMSAGKIPERIIAVAIPEDVDYFLGSTKSGEIIPLPGAQIIKRSAPDGKLMEITIVLGKAIKPPKTDKRTRKALEAHSSKWVNPFPQENKWHVVCGRIHEKGKISFKRMREMVSFKDEWDVYRVERYLNSHGMTVHVQGALLVAD